MLALILGNIRDSGLVILLSYLYFLRKNCEKNKIIEYMSCLLNKIIK